MGEEIVNCLTTIQNTSYYHGHEKYNGHTMEEENGTGVQ